MKTPNIVLIIADHHRGDYLGCLGTPLLTPNLDKMASEGAILRRMYCVAPACVPSRISLSTGRYPLWASTTSSLTSLLPQHEISGRAA